MKYCDILLDNMGIHTTGAMALYLLLLQYCEGREDCGWSMSNREIMMGLRMRSYLTFKKARDQLIASNLIRYESSGTRADGRYWVIE